MLPTRTLFDILSQPFKRSQLGLFHGKIKRYGNNNPFSKKKTRRTWLPNVQSKRLVSDILGQTLKLKVTTRALRTIKKYGGLDNYVLNTRHELIGWEGLRLRVQLRRAQEEKLKKAEEERASPSVQSTDAELEKLKMLVKSPSARAGLRRSLEQQRKERISHTLG